MLRWARKGWCLCLLMWPIGLFAAPIEIKVGGYDFPPYVSHNVSTNRYSGVSLDILRALNHLQDKFTFRFVSTSRHNRHAAFTRKRFDLILFENLEWGWQSLNVQQSLPLVLDKNLLLTHQQNVSGQDQLFAPGHNYTVVLFDAAYQSQHLSDEGFAVNSCSHVMNCIKLVVKRRADFTMVNESFYLPLTRQKPSLLQSLKSIAHFSPVHSLHALQRADSSLSVEQLNFFFKQLSLSGELQAILSQYDLAIAE
ncbi:transporter substrate-binding domain-containing protein [Agarivorans sp. 1_MG-2023]|uniref:transporter substrate-binding domain-containing protein n=1 Tax=Agarivorans sp. 1_MG-2023 TaxID=3062634 RepID=UPI0026E25433|nr:transporter substrate-binding domain-containing protein [Agarivorans sp. 1_MG-2023]MDO6762923.1 transporter substrate-binding domain-containing protein [Agarivorans sp. 1_MG-2023]